jgi:uncharacterized membrane protein
MTVRANILLLSLLLGAGFVYGADRATNDSPPSMSMAAFLRLVRSHDTRHHFLGNAALLDHSAD